ncbi:MAG: tetraacyldisaccharide 4'-kinase [Gemmatimonadota bacterium]|nr:MAG: tetraacyldisaccharide 4'-kinase [Gemmatimonadota bacterium]
MSDWHQRLWTVEGPGYRLLSALLVPAEMGYRLGVSARAWMYDHGFLSSADAPIPTLAVGNLTVGGTGKTPVTAWFAGTLAARGFAAAVVMRGYGGDEVQVHRLLNPEVPVHVSVDRTEGVRQAQRDGAEMAVLDDAFQHRALRADVNLVLVAAEEWSASRRLLPRGPWREPLTALNRADLVITTRKVAGRGQAAQVTASLGELCPSLPRAEAYIGLAGLASYDGASRQLDTPKPARGLHCALAVAGVARPGAVFAQLAEAGVTVDDHWSFPDHHSYSAEEVERILRRTAGGSLVATLKDAVKLGTALGPEIEIYVPLQTVEWETGREEVDRLLCRLSDVPRSRRGQPA